MGNIFLLEEHQMNTKILKVTALILLLACMALHAYLHDDMPWMVLWSGFSIGYLVSDLLGR